MKLPAVRGIIDRRILVNYRVDAAVLARLLPSPFRPIVVGDAGLVGICLIRLKDLRPRSAPAWLGISSENSAHRAAVEWDDNGQLRHGVYIFRRDTSSRINAVAGGRLFAGRHHHAQFAVCESNDRYRIHFNSDDGSATAVVSGRRCDDWPQASVFDSLDEASAFFRNGSVGFSASYSPSRFEGLELTCRNWLVEPLHVDELASSFFDNEAQFPMGSIQFDCALLMRGVEHEWHGVPDLCCDGVDYGCHQFSRLSTTAPQGVASAHDR